MRKILSLSLVFSLFLLSSCTTPEKNPKYVFLFIGDGMGVNQIFSTEIYLASENETPDDSILLMNTFPVSSNMTTFSADKYVTCSSAAGTAMASGFKTNNGVLGKSPDLSEEYRNISVKAKSEGYKVGIVSSVAIDHATPAAFYAHQDSRSMYYEISMELPNYDIDYFGGGGFHYPTGRNQDMPNAYENAEQKGYTIVDTKAGLDTLAGDDEKVFAINPKTYPKGEFLWAIDREEGDFTLADFTQKGIDVLENQNGFFMMVEGGKIDWACHASDAATMVHEVLEFNDAVKVAYDFYKKYPEETLIIVTADHETGSLFTGFDYTINPEHLKHQKISGQEFARKMEELAVTNPKVSYDEVMQLVKASFGLGDEALGLGLSIEEEEKLKSAYTNEFVKQNTASADADYLDKTEVLSVTETAVAILNRKAGFGWGTDDHSAMPVPVRAIGAGQEAFSPYFDNTELPVIISKLMSLESN